MFWVVKKSKGCQRNMQEAMLTNFNRTLKYKQIMVSIRPEKIQHTIDKNPRFFPSTLDRGKNNNVEMQSGHCWDCRTHCCVRACCTPKLRAAVDKKLQERQNESLLDWGPPMLAFFFFRGVVTVCAYFGPTATLSMILLPSVLFFYVKKISLLPGDDGYKPAGGRWWWDRVPAKSPAEYAKHIVYRTELRNRETFSFIEIALSPSPPLSTLFVERGGGSAHVHVFVFLCVRAWCDGVCARVRVCTCVRV